MNYIDLTHTLSKDIPSWDGTADFELAVVSDYQDCTPPDLFRNQKLGTSVSLGTHIDAPAHVVPGGRTIDMLTTEELVTHCVVIDVSSEAGEGYKIVPASVEKFEQQYGQIPPASFVIFYTGWSKYWDEPEKYTSGFSFPSLDVTTAELLLQRNIVGIGIDTFSCDTGKQGFPVHRAVLGADKYLVENVANADKLPPTGSTIFVMPLKLKDAAESPIRLVVSVNI